MSGCKPKTLLRELKLSKSDCRGFVKPSGQVKRPVHADEYLDLNELVCVIAGLKPMVTLDLGAASRVELRKHRQGANRILRMAANCGIRALKGRGGRWYAWRPTPAAQEQAMTLAYLDAHRSVAARHNTWYLTGWLYGYADANIRGFYRRVGKPGQYAADRKAARVSYRHIRDSPEFVQFHKTACKKVGGLPLV